MARKGWDALSENYRRRLSKQGVSRSDYESNAPLHKARGHVSQPTEAFSKRVARFVATFDSSDTPAQEKARIKALGPVQGQTYMDYRREMTRLYESGDYVEAETMYQNRDQSIRKIVHYRLRDGKIVDATWWYHGMFGG